MSPVFGPSGASIAAPGRSAPSRGAQPAAAWVIPAGTTEADGVWKLSLANPGTVPAVVQISLIDAHGPDVHRFLVAMVRSTVADDCYQETWIAALRGYPRLRDAANLRGWLLTIAHRKAIDQVRARARRPVPMGDVPEQPAHESTSYNGQNDL